VTILQTKYLHFIWYIQVKINIVILVNFFFSLTCHLNVKVLLLIPSEHHVANTGNIRIHLFQNILVKTDIFVLFNFSLRLTSQEMRNV